jgi:hypothetical protein
MAEQDGMFAAIEQVFAVAIDFELAEAHELVGRVADEEEAGGF